VGRRTPAGRQTTAAAIKRESRRSAVYKPVYSRIHPGYPEEQALCRIQASLFPDTSGLPGRAGVLPYTSQPYSRIHPGYLEEQASCRIQASLFPDTSGLPGRAGVLPYTSQFIPGYIRATWKSRRPAVYKPVYSRIHPGYPEEQALCRIQASLFPDTSGLPGRAGVLPYTSQPYSRIHPGYPEERIQAKLVISVIHRPASDPDNRWRILPATPHTSGQRPGETADGRQPSNARDDCHC
jgi:hypothetical protein